MKRKIQIARKTFVKCFLNEAFQSYYDLFQVNWLVKASDIYNNYL